MANNRMYLCYRPTGHAVFLAKRMGHGWYSVPCDIKARVERLLEMAEHKGEFYQQDDFMLAMESASGAPHAEERWMYHGFAGDGPVPRAAGPHIELLHIEQQVPHCEPGSLTI